MMGRKWTGKVNIVHYVTHKYMMRNKKRTATTYVGILFMVLLMTCVFVGRETAIGFLQEAASSKDGKWHFAFSDVTDAQYEQIRNLDYIQDMDASMTLGLTDFVQSANEERPYLNVKAYGEKCFEWYNIKLLEGRFPQQGQELVLSSACREDGADIQIGDTVRADFFQRTFTGIQKDGGKKTVFPMYQFFEIPKGKTVTPPEQFPYFEPNDSFRENKEMTGKSVQYTVVGFVEAPAYENKQGAGYTALTLLDAGTFAEMGKRNVSVQVDFARAPKEIYMQFYDIAGAKHVDANNFYLAFTGNSSDSTMNRMVSLMTIFFVTVIMAASIILIYNVFNLSFRERSRYLGMLSSVGATARQKRSSIYYEAFCLLLFAMPAGILGGFGVILGGMALLKPFLVKFITADGLTVQDIPVTLLVSWKGVLAVVVVSIITVLISAFLPARAISRRGAVESIRGNGERKNRTYRMNRNVYKKHGAVKMLAGNVLARQRKKKQGVSFAVIIFLVILIVTAFGADTIHIVLDKKTEPNDLAQTMLGEQEGILYDGSHMAADEAEAAWKRENFLGVKKELKNHEAVQEIKEWYQGIWCGQISYDSFFSKEYLAARMAIAKAYLGTKMTEEQILKQYFTDSQESICILVVDEPALQDIANRCGADYGILADPSRMGAMIVNEVELSTDHVRYETGAAERYLYYDIAHISDLKERETFPVNFYDQTDGEFSQRTFTAAGYADESALDDYVSLSGEYTWLIMGAQAAGSLADSLGYRDLSEMFEEELLLTFESNSGDLQAYLRSVGQTDNDNGVIFLDKDSQNIQQTLIWAIKKIVDIMLACFVLLTSALCFLNMGNSIGGRMAERRREFAVMQSVGMTRAQIRQMLFLECCGILASALITALSISMLLICALRYGLSSMFGRLVLQIPFAWVILAAVVAAGAVFFLTFYSFGKEKGQNLLEEIRQETV